MRNKMVINSSSIINPSDGMSAITQHACSSTEGWIAWVIVGSIWLVLFFLINSSERRELAVGAASFVGLVFAIGFVIFGCGSTTLIILMVILAAVGLSLGFILQ